MAMKVLFVCSANVSRSRTAEELFMNKEELEVKSAGTRWTARKKVSEEIINWADKIFVMEQHHKDHIIKKKPEAEKKIIVLDIPDIYGRNDPLLIEALLDKLENHLPATHEIKPKKITKQDQ